MSFKAHSCKLVYATSMPSTLPEPVYKGERDGGMGHAGFRCCVL